MKADTLEYKVIETNWPEKHFATVRRVVAIEKLPAFFAEQYGVIYQELMKHAIPCNEPPCAIYYHINEEKKEVDVAAAVPVSGPTSGIQNVEVLTLPSSKVLSVTYFGPYENMMPAYEAIEKAMDERHWKKDLVIEEYFSDPEKEKDPAKWKTAIHFVVKGIVA